MQVGDVVTLTDARGEVTGRVTKLLSTPGMVTVEWDSGVTEHIHESELTKANGTPSLGETVPPWEKGLGEAVRGETVPMPDLDDDSGYEPDDPKHPSFRERLAALWDSRPGK